MEGTEVMAKTRNKFEENKKETLENAFKKINRNLVRLNKDDKKRNTAILYSILDEIINRLCKADQLFCSLKPKLDYLGSYYDGLRVGTPDEYDINVILTFPVNYDRIILDSTETKFDYTSVVMPSEFRRLSKNPATMDKGFFKTVSWCDRKHRLSLSKFRSWMQRVVDVALKDTLTEDGKRILKVNGQSFEIIITSSGPANTLQIIGENNKPIDVDLVPTFAFELPKVPINCKVDFNKVKETNIKQYFVVPKPTDNDYSWRLTFPFQERYYLKDKNYLKPTLKLIKLLRDVQGFKQLASYYIKTIFLWEILAKRNSRCKNFWTKKSLSFLVLHMMKKLRDHLAIEKIRNFWCPDSNLIEKIKIETCENWRNRLTFIINDIEQRRHDDPYAVIKYFTRKTS